MTASSARTAWNFDSAMSAAWGWLNVNGAALTFIVAIAAILVAWVIFRLDDWSERSGLIRAIEAELAGYRWWVGNAYPPDENRDAWADPTYMVFKLSTVAIDSAIARGPALMLYRETVQELVVFRQRLETLNQYIETVTQYQAAALTSPVLTVTAQQQIAGLTRGLHVFAIADDRVDRAHSAFNRLDSALQREMRASWRRTVWAIFGITWRADSGRALAALRGRAIARPSVMTLPKDRQFRVAVGPKSSTTTRKRRPRP